MALTAQSSNFEDANNDFQAKMVTLQICLSHVRPMYERALPFPGCFRFAGVQPWCMDLWPDDPVRLSQS